MRIGIPKEIKDSEYRVGMTPTGVRELVAHGHDVVVERDAGVGIGAADSTYEDSGAQVLASAAEVFAAAEMIVKVKEPQAVEVAMLRPQQVLFTYLHLAADRALTEGLLAAQIVGIAYETVTAEDGSLPLLAPMSEVAGRLSIQAGARSLERDAGGRGVLLGGVPGVPAAEVLIVGGGTVGTNAIQMALGLEARVTVLDKSLPRLRALEAQFGGQLNTVYATRDAMSRYVPHADLVVGAVLVPGAAAPKLLTRELLRTMQPGAVLVDVSIDQGGVAETSRATTHEDPVYIVDDVVHYCVANMPGAVPRTSTYALTNATLPAVLELADQGYAQALANNPHLAKGLNVHRGAITHPAVAAAFGKACEAVDLNVAAA